jgi:hypothetical protein
LWGHDNNSIIKGMDKKQCLHIEKIGVNNFATCDELFVT